MLAKKARKQLYKRTKRLLGERRAAGVRDRVMRVAQHLSAWLPIVAGALRRLSLQLLRTPVHRVETLILVDADHLLLSLAVIDPQRRIDGITLDFNDKRRIHCSLENLSRHPTGSMAFLWLPRSVQHRLTGHIDLPGADHPGLVLRRVHLEGAANRISSRRCRISVAHGEALTRVQGVLELVPEHGQGKRALFDQSVGPAIERIWASRTAPIAGGRRVDYNRELATAKPSCSLIVPIYGRYDFMEFQLAQFVMDDFLLQQEILYVIDDPRLEAEIRQAAESLARIYRLSFSVVFLERNLGYSGANNAGVSHATGKHVLLLNSDVFPVAPGWLNQMLDAAGLQMNKLLVGARLLYEDGSVQHDGMQFSASPFMEDLWTNIHPAKGLPEDQLFTGRGLLEREALTGACLLITRENYLALGGFDERYILGDFEDSDLCLRAHRMGLSARLAPAARLYHLERQSQTLVTDRHWKNELTYYNCWQHTRRWHDEIQRIKTGGQHG